MAEPVHAESVNHAVGQVGGGSVYDDDLSSLWTSIDATPNLKATAVLLHYLWRESVGRCSTRCLHKTGE